MRDYVNIITKIKQTPWLITSDGLEVVLSIVDMHLKGNDELIQVRLSELQTGAAGDGVGDRGKGGIGVLPLHGPIFGRANMMTELSGATSLEMFSKDLDQMLNDDNIESIVLDIDSPGGTSDLVAETGDQIFMGRDVKPIYALANNMAGSAAYWLGSQATEFYTTSSGMVGSIGVYTVHEDHSGADAQAGRKFTYVSAGPYKTEGNPHEPLSNEGREFLQSIVNETYEDFIAAVANGRGYHQDDVKETFGKGRLVTSKMALEAGMVDGITTMDKLVGNLTDKPRPVTVMIPSDGGIDARAVGGYEQGGRVYLTSINLESKELEHSEPGFGSPPPPRTNEDGSDDPAIKGGWRGDGRVPLEPTDPNAPKPEAVMTEQELAALRTLLGLKADAEATEVMAAVEQLQAEVEPLREAVKASSAESNFARDYPGIYKNYISLMDQNRQAQARDFVSGVMKLQKPEGDGYKDTGFALSAAAMENIESAYIRFATGVGTLDVFTEAIEAIMHGGLLQYGEMGSSQPIEVTPIDTTTSQGIAEVRKAFAAKVTEIQTQDGVDFATALKLASQRYPDLAAAYQVSGVGR